MALPTGYRLENDSSKNRHVFIKRKSNKKKLLFDIKIQYTSQCSVHNNVTRFEVVIVINRVRTTSQMGPLSSNYLSIYPASGVIYMGYIFTYVVYFVSFYRIVCTLCYCKFLLHCNVCTVVARRYGKFEFIPCAVVNNTILHTYR